MNPLKNPVLIVTFTLGVFSTILIGELHPSRVINAQHLTQDIFSTSSITQTLYHYYKNQQAIPPHIVPDLSLAEAYRIQSQFISLLSSRLGKPVGYKVGLTNPIIQEKLKINHPVSGVLLEEMLLPSGTKIKAHFGAIPRVEGDLMVRVGSEKINQAKTTKEILESLDAVIPFMELPDLIYQENVPLTGAKLVAVNIGTRYGIVGEPILLENKAEWKDKISQIQLIIKDQNNQVLSQGNSQALLGDPLKVVLWLKDHLKSQDKTLKKGDLISLGTITPFLAVKSGQTIIAQYQGLDEHHPVEISVTFTD